MVERLMTLLHWLRHPHDKPPYVKHYEDRQDAVEQRLRVLSAESARRARELVRER